MTGAGIDVEPGRMLPATAYTSPEVFAWEQRNLFAGGWTCVGRVDELLPAGDGDRPVRQRAARVGDVGVLLVRAGDDALRMFANTCRHRGHELLAENDSSQRRSIVCPYHAWTYDLAGNLTAAKGFLSGQETLDGFSADAHRLVELPVRVWHGFVLAHALHPLGHPDVPDFDAYLGDLDTIVAPYAPGLLELAQRHAYTVAANWKVIAENYHECYHCPLIHPELCLVSPPDSGDNYDLPGTWIGGSMRLCDGMRTMSMTGQYAATPLPGAPAGTVEYVHLLPNLLISAHPDYVMVHRLVPRTPDRTWVECSWFVTPGAGEARDAAEFWDVTNRQDWAACESVQRGLSGPHFMPGPFAPNEDAVARLVALIGAAYAGGDR